MTVLSSDWIEMGDAEASALEEQFALLDRMTIPEGFKAEIVEGAVVVSPQRSTHWKIIESVLLQVKERFGRHAKTESDVLLVVPGFKNGFAPDLAKLSDRADRAVDGRWTYQDVEFVLEVISRETADNDYGKKLRGYAAARIPVYVVADPYSGKCHAYGNPEGEGYENHLAVKFGEELDLAPLGFDMRLVTEDFPQD